jgi:hypothetical protein
VLCQVSVTVQVTVLGSWQQGMIVVVAIAGHDAPAPAWAADNGRVEGSVATEVIFSAESAPETAGVLWLWGRNS